MTLFVIIYTIIINVLSYSWLANDFDTANHNILLLEIEKLDIAGFGIKLIESYLHGKIRKL